MVRWHLNGFAVYWYILPDFPDFSILGWQGIKTVLHGRDPVWCIVYGEMVQGGVPDDLIPFFQSEFGVRFEKRTEF